MIGCVSDLREDAGSLERVCRDDRSACSRARAWVHARAVRSNTSGLARDRGRGKPRLMGAEAVAAFVLHARTTPTGVISSSFCHRKR